MRKGYGERKKEECGEIQFNFAIGKMSYFSVREYKNTKKKLNI